MDFDELLKKYLLLKEENLQIKSSPEICHFRPKNRLVRKHQPSKLWQCRRKHDAN